MDPKIKHCTSCGSEAPNIEVVGNKYLCRVCNIVYEVTDTGTKAIDTDPLSKDRAAIKKLQEDVTDLKGQGGGKVPEPDQDQEPDPDDSFEGLSSQGEEDEGFVSW